MKKKYRQQLLMLALALLLVSGISLNLINRAPVSASGDASFTLAPSSGSHNVGTTLTITVSETSSGGDNVNAVEANLSYPTADLTYQSTTLSGPFSLCGDNTGGSGTVTVACASSTTETGTQSVAQISFTVIGAGTAAVDMIAGSDIDNTSGTSVWNGSLPTTSFTLVAVPPTVTFSSLTAAAEVYGNPFAINSTSTANNGGSIANSKLLVNGATVQTLSSSPYNFSLNTLGYPDGTYNVAITSTDNQANASTNTLSVYITNGDLNFDGKVNISDLAILAGNWGKTSQTYAQGSINGSGTVNLSDLAIMAANWGYID